MQNIINSVKNTRRSVQEALQEIDAILANADEEASNDTFYVMTQLLRELRERDIDIEAMCADAMQDE
jgi:hypothetical protein